MIIRSKNIASTKLNLLQGGASGQRQYCRPCMTSLARRSSAKCSATVFVHTPRINSSSPLSATLSRCNKSCSLSSNLRWATSKMHDSAPQRNGEDHAYARNAINIPSPEEASLSELCAFLHDRVSSFLESSPTNDVLRDVQRQTAISLDVLKEALDQYRIDELALSYNGGKDCLVLLVLWLVTLHRHFGRSRSASSALLGVANSTRSLEDFPTSINTVYIRPPDPFPEVEEFVRYSARQYHLTLTTLTKSMKAAFSEYLEMNPQVQAIFVGTRRTDPHGSELDHFNRTDGGWPDFMRCHPVIDWHYREIWTFIRYLNIPYCPLYDLGYTSLGGTNDTNPNPRLKSISEESGEGRALYRPAYELLEDDEERLGRPVGK